MVQHPFDSDYLRGVVYKNYLKQKSFYSTRSKNILRTLYLTRMPKEEQERRINPSALQYLQKRYRV